MDCPWRRTVASVFLLLFSHNVRVLSQNVVPTGALPPFPLLREPLRDCAGPGPFSQQMNILPGPPNGIPPEFVPLGPYPPDNQRIPEYVGPLYPQGLPLNPGLQGNIGPFPQGFNFILPPPSLQGPIYNAPPNINVPPPQGLPLNTPQPPLGQIPVGPQFNIPQTPLVPIPLSVPFNIPQTPLVQIPLGAPLNTPPIGNVSPYQGPPLNILPVPLVPIPQGADCLPPITNVPIPQSIPPFISSIPLAPAPLAPVPLAPVPLAPGPLAPVPLAPIQPGQVLPNSQIPLTPISAYLPPVAGLQNQNLQIFPLVSTSYPQQFLPPCNGPCTLTTDLTSVHSLPTPNIPSSIPIQNYASPPIYQPPIQQVMYPQPIFPIDLFPYTQALPNYQISGLPPVFPVNIPVPCDNICGNSQLVTEEYNPVPINLHINMPSPTIPEPKITIITAYPTLPESPTVITTTDSSDKSFEMLPSYPLPPIIIEGRRSSSRSWLPLFLVALFARDGYWDGGVGGGCCCPCNPGNADVPIPFPIPVPTSNPIILGNSCRTSKKAQKVKGSDKKD